MASSSSSSQPPKEPPVLTQAQLTQLAGQGIHLIRNLRTTVLQINEMVNNAPSMKEVDQHILKRMFVRMNDIYGKLEDIAHQLPEKMSSTAQLDALASLYNAERADNNLFGANPPPAIAQQKTQVDGYLKGIRQTDSANQYWYYAEQLYKMGGTVPGNSAMYAQRRRLFLDPPPLVFTEVTPENNPHSSFINAFFHMKEEAHKKKYGIWMEVLENSGQGSILEIKTGNLVEKQPVITQKTLVLENNGSVDMIIFVAPHEEWKFLDEAGEYGKKVDIMQKSKFLVYQKLTALANVSLSTLLTHGQDRTPAQIMQNLLHILSRYHKIFETKCKICSKVMKNYLPCVYFDPRQPAQSVHEGLITLQLQQSYRSLQLLSFFRWKYWSFAQSLSFLGILPIRIAEQSSDKSDTDDSESQESEKHKKKNSEEIHAARSRRDRKC